jgi:hypothetical protein
MALRRQGVISRREMCQPLASRNYAIVWKAVPLLAGLVFFAISPGFPSDVSIKYTGTFSSLRYHKEAGDLLGVEIRIVSTRKGYQGALQIAEGGA